MGSNFARSDIPLIYFFVSEALTNVAKHAQATRATLRLTVDNDQLTVEVADDGIGGASLESGAAASRGSPIASLRSKVDSLALRSEPDAGTTLYATVPLKGGSQRESRSGPLEK